MSNQTAHQAELERLQCHIKLDYQYPYHGAHGRFTYNSHVKKLDTTNWNQ